MLPTPPRGDAVTLGYEIVKPPLDGDFHPANSYTITGALAHIFEVFNRPPAKSATAIRKLLTERSILDG